LIQFGLELGGEDAQFRRKRQLSDIVVNFLTEFEQSIVAHDGREICALICHGGTS
jgi:hypothetical protein